MENLQNSGFRDASNENSFDLIDLNKTRLPSRSMHAVHAVNKDAYESSSDGESVGDSTNQPLYYNKQVHELMNASIDEDDDFFLGKEEELENEKPDTDNEFTCHDSTSADSDDDYEAHFEAIDELAEIFADPEPSKTVSAPFSKVPFERPSNPVCHDSQFFMPRCSAPALLVEQRNPEHFMSATLSQQRYGSMPSYNMERQSPYWASSAPSVISTRPSSLPNYQSNSERHNENDWPPSPHCATSQWLMQLSNINNNFKDTLFLVIDFDFKFARSGIQENCLVIKKLFVSFSADFQTEREEGNSKGSRNFRSMYELAKAAGVQSRTKLRIMNSATFQKPIII